MKQHLEDDDLILHFYGETGTAAEPHLSDCVDCRARYQALQRVLNVVEAPPAPYRGPEYENDVWHRLAPKLGHKRRSSWFTPRRWVPVMAAAALLVVAFFAGRYSPRPQQQQQQVAQTASGVHEGVLLVAVGDHLERSEMLLIEIANANPERSMNLTDGRETAQDLVHANRLYRQTAASSGDDRVVSLLDDLERVLLEVAHSPEELHGSRLETLRERIKNEGLIFKIRVAGSKLAQGEML
jgi:hypothetical protein